MIIPDLAELTALRAAAQGLSLRAHRPALARLQGQHRSAQRGRGLEFEEVRLYAAGDDVRNIDWRVTARRGKVHTKLFREERERPVWLLADLHPGLYFGSRRQFKSGVLLRSAAMLAWAAAVGGDRIGAVIGDDQHEPLIFPPRAREAGVLPVLQALVQAQPQAPGTSSGSSLQQLLSTLQPLLQPGSMVLLLSDFTSLDSAAEELLARVLIHSDCRLLCINDTLEREGLPDGSYRAGWPGRLRWISGSASRAHWQAAWQAREKKLRDMSQRLNLPLSELNTHEPVVESMIALLKESA